MYYTENDFRLYHHGIKGMKWGVRRYQNPDGTYTDLGKKMKRVGRTSSDISKEARKYGSKIKSDVVSVMHRAGAKPYGLEHMYKTDESINRKLKKKASENDDISLKDAVRFTAVSSDRDFVRNYNSIKRGLEDKGYTETRCKNYFVLYKQGKVKHKSVQCNFKNEDGYEFEIQFQTPSSQKAKDKKVPIYEEARRTDVSPSRLKELERQMDILAESVSDPVGIERIKSH